MLDFLKARKKEVKSSILDYYVMSMTALWESVQKDLGDADQKKAVGKIEKYLANPTQDWVEAYRTEQLIVPFMSEVQLDMRYEARLSEAKDRLFVFNTSTHEKNWDVARDPKKTENLLAAKRAAFHALLDEIQWEYIARRFNRKVRLEVASRLWILGLIVLFVVLLPWLVLSTCSLFENLCSPMHESPSDRATRAPAFEFYAAISFGLLGAFFSRLNSFQSQASTLSYVQLTETFRVSFLIVRLGFGMVGSMILYFMLVGEFLKGGLFPEIDAIGFDSHVVSLWDIQLVALLPDSNFAKLIVWSFIGGFSERLVPAALEKAEATAQGSQSSNDK